MVIRILAFAGSTRKESLNKKVLKIAIEGARKATVEVTEIDLKNYLLPIYDGDDEDENGVPKLAQELKKLFHAHHAILIACPEYNSSISGVLKNTIDWISRAEPTDPKEGYFAKKVVGLLAASPGALGGIRGLVTVRSILGNLGMHVIPEQMCISKAHEAFDETGKMKDETLKSAVMKIGSALAETALKLNS